MTGAPTALVAHSRDVPSAARGALAHALRAALPAGAVLLETCHRVEVYAPAGLMPPTPGMRALTGEVAARHVVSLAVGRASTVLAEDQILHQLRLAVAAARARAPLDPSLDRLLDVALRAGRRARSWLPGRRPSLADVALASGLARGDGRRGPILVVGAGEMGNLAARAAARTGAPVLVASRSFERAARLAAEVGGRAVSFALDERELTAPSGVLVALSGPWPIAPAAAAALAAGGTWVVDLSSPPAVDPGLAAALGERFASVDDLAREPAGAPAGVAVRLDALVAATVAEYAAWLANAPEREAARTLADRAMAARAAELEALWERVPALAPEERAEVERMAERLAARLLRDPLERLRGDADGRRRRAARELFGL